MSFMPAGTPIGSMTTRLVFIIMGSTRKVTSTLSGKARLRAGVSTRTRIVVVSLNDEMRIGSVATAASPLAADPTAYTVAESGTTTGLPTRATCGPGVTL